MGASALVMAKAPLPGRVKTRLEPLFTPEQCAELQDVLIRRTAAWAAHVAPGAAYLAYDPPEAHDDVAALVPDAIALLPQRGGNLGERLEAASADVLARHPGPLMIVGVDTRLDAGHAATALQRLSHGADVVFGPALDGGYYLVAIARPAPELFAIEPGAWGGPDVLELSLAAARAAGLNAATLDPARDLDTPEDAAELIADPELGPLLAPVLHGRGAL